jgi:CheY-like chemotaxis protein
MTTEPPADRQPRVMVLWFEPSILRFVHEILTLEGYAVSATQSAQRALDRLARGARRYVVLMDNFQVNDEARKLATDIFATPELHQRVRVIGLAAFSHQGLIPLDAFIAMPFSVEGLVEPIAAACADLRAAAVGGP